MPRRILAIRLRALGDVVLTTPGLRALKRGHPDAALEVVTEDRYASLIRGLPEVDRVWPLRRTSAATLGLLVTLRRRRYERVVDFFGNARSAFLAGGCGARLSFGYDLRGRRLAYRTPVPRSAPPVDGQPEFAAATHVRLAVAAGGIQDGLDVRLSISDVARRTAQQVLARLGVRAPRFAVGVVAPGNWPTKTWPLSHFAVLCRRLQAAGRPVLALCGPEEERVMARLREFVPGLPVLSPADVAVLAAAISELGAVVGTDSGPRHLAAAFGVPTFTWFGPADPRIWTPPGDLHGYWWTDLPCRGCNRTLCPHWSCLPALSPATAADLVIAHLDRHVRPSADLDPAAGA